MNRKRFYDSRAWIRARDYCMKRNFYKCALCGGRAVHVHHVIELTDENYTNPDISLNQENLIPVCLDCHNKLHERFGSGSPAVRDGFGFDADGNLIHPPILEKNSKNTGCGVSEGFPPKGFKN